MDDVCESKGLEWIQTQIENPKEEQNHIGLSMSLDPPSHICSKETGVGEQASSNASLQAAATTTSELMTQEDECQSFQCESSRQPGQFEEGGSDGTGKTAYLLFRNPLLVTTLLMFYVKMHFSTQSFC